MAVQIRWQDGFHQWIKGTLYQGQKPYTDNYGFTRYEDGFTINCAGKNVDFASDVSVISMTPDNHVTDWSRRDNNR